MFESGISRETKKVLATLASQEFVGSYYLAGGTACALYFGHRLSYDLDFFSQVPVEPTRISQKLKSLGKLKVEQQSEGTWLGELDGVKLSFFEHLYPQIDQENIWEGVRIAGKKDLAVMKLEAIGSRGVRRDFVDMYYLSWELGLPQIFEWAKIKYNDTDISTTHFARSLVYFEQAEEDVWPKMIHELAWEDVKEYFRTQVKRLSREWGI